MDRRAVVGSLAVLAALVAAAVAPLEASARSDARAADGCGPSAFTRAALPGLGPGTAELYGIDAWSASGAWAVGGRYDPGAGATVPYALGWDGSSWTDTPVPYPAGGQGAVLMAVSAAAADDVWAVGTKTMANNLSRTFASHWDGSGWTTVATPNAGAPGTGVLNGVVAVAPDDAWAVGSTSGQGGPERTLILRWDGSTWSVVPSPNRGPWPNGLSDVAAVASTDVWAVGTWRTKAFVGRTLSLRWDGSAWRRVATPSPGTRDDGLSGVSTVAADDVWAVGGRGLRGLAERWDGSAWEVVPTPNPSVNAGLSDVVAITAAEAWASGSWIDLVHRRVAAQVQRWDGSAWTPVTTQHVGTSDNGLAAIDGVASRQWAVGYRFNATGRRILPLVLERCA